jgi:hypothetical protein
MQKESLAFFKLNGFNSFLSITEEFKAYCHIKEVSSEPIYVFQLKDLVKNTEKFWVRDNEVFDSLENLLSAFPVLHQQGENRL